MEGRALNGRCSWLLVVANPGIKPGITQVDDQVDDDEDCRNEHTDAENHRNIALIDRGEPQASHTRQTEYDLHEQGSTGSGPNAKPDHGRQRSASVLEDVN